MLEWGGTDKMTHHTQKGGLVITEDMRTGLEGIGNGESDQDRVTEHLVGVGARAGGGTPGTEAGERGRGGAPEKKADKGNTHPVWNGLIFLGDR